MKKKAFTLVLLLVFLQLPLLFAFQAPGPKSKQTQKRDMVAAARAFLASLPADQQQLAVYPFEDPERFNWHFVPRDRRGLAVRDMDARQKQLALALLQTGLSSPGFDKARSIMELEAVLKELENRGPDDDYRHPGKYFFTVFGTPSATQAWGWRLEGHHLAFNFTSVSGQLVAATPSFMGANPGIVPAGPAKGRQVLRQEAELAFALVNSLSAAQLQQALINEKAPADIITGNQRKALLEKPAGIRYRDLNTAQQQALDRLLGVYLHNYRSDLAGTLQKKVDKAGRDELYFAWAGHREPGAGKAHYYRIHSPALLIEYDNSQNQANHVHTVVRDLNNDFGEDALKRHYQKHKH